MQRVRRSLMPLLVSAAFVAVLLWRVDVARLRRDLTTADWRWVLLGVPLFAASQGLQGLRWWLLVRQTGAVSLRVGVLARVASTGVDLALPAHAGYGALAQLLYQRYGIARATVLGTLGAEGAVVGLALVPLVLVLLPFVPLALPVSPRVLLVGTSGLVAAAGGLVWVARQRRTGRIGRGLPPLVARVLRDQLDPFIAGVATLMRGRVLPLALAVLLAEWAVAAGGLALVGRGFHLHAAVLVYLVAEIASYLSYAVPLTQGNLGPYELALGGTLAAYGTDTDQAAAYALGAHALVVLTTVLVALSAGAALRVRRADLFYLHRAERGMGHPVTHPSVAGEETTATALPSPCEPTEAAGAAERTSERGDHQGRAGRCGR